MLSHTILLTQNTQKWLLNTVLGLFKLYINTMLNCPSKSLILLKTMHTNNWMSTNRTFLHPAQIENIQCKHDERWHNLRRYLNIHLYVIKPPIKNISLNLHKNTISVLSIISWYIQAIYDLTRHREINVLKKQKGRDTSGLSGSQRQVKQENRKYGNK